MYIKCIFYHTSFAIMSTIFNGCCDGFSLCYSWEPVDGMMPKLPGLDSQNYVFLRIMPFWCVIEHFIDKLCKLMKWNILWHNEFGGIYLRHLKAWAKIKWGSNIFSCHWLSFNSFTELVLSNWLHLFWRIVSHLSWCQTDFVITEQFCTQLCSNSIQIRLHLLDANT